MCWQLFYSGSVMSLFLINMKYVLRLCWGLFLCFMICVDYVLWWYLYILRIIWNIFKNQLMHLQMHQYKKNALYYALNVLYWYGGVWTEHRRYIWLNFLVDINNMIAMKLIYYVKNLIRLLVIMRCFLKAAYLSRGIERMYESWFAKCRSGVLFFAFISWVFKN